MHWYDYAAILLALSLALMADMDARSALRASVAVYLRSTAGDASPHYVSGTGWVRSYNLRKIFGPFVYTALHNLHNGGAIERFEEKLSEHKIVRDGRANVLYRWKPTKEPDA